MDCQDVSLEGIMLVDMIKTERAPRDPERMVVRVVPRHLRLIDASSNNFNQ